MKRKAESEPQKAPLKRHAEYAEAVKTLNTQFSEWVRSTLSASPSKSLEPGFRDYSKHLAKLRSEFSDVLLSAPGEAEDEAAAGQCMVLGQGDMGQLGLGDDVSELGKPAILKAPGGLRAVKVACGGMHTLLLCEGGQLFSWGVNDEGALGRSARGGHLALQQGATDGDESRPERVAMPAGVRVKSLSAGDSHSAALSFDGRVFAWGVFRDSSGKFGFSATEGVQNTPVPVSIGESIAMIASGSDHILALSGGGTVYSWGCGEFGRLARLTESECDAKAERADKNAWKASLLTPARVSQMPPASYVACGLYCSFAVCGGDVFAAGVNNYGQLGTEEDGPFYQMTRVKSLSNRGVASIGGGEHHTLFLTNSGQVLSCGRATYGRLGRAGVDCASDNKYGTPQPVAVPGNSPVSLVVGGLSVSACVCKDGSCYAWGSGGEGLLGKGGDERDEHLPCKMEADFQGGVASLSIGGQHMAMIVVGGGAGGGGNKRQR